MGLRAEPASAADARGGMALLVALLVLLGLGLIAGGALTAALQEVRTTRARGRQVHARAAAVDALARAVRIASLRSAHPVVPGVETPLPDADVVAGAAVGTSSLEELGSGLAVLRGYGRVLQGSDTLAAITVALLVQAPDPPSILRLFPAAVTLLGGAASVLDGGRVQVVPDACPGDSVLPSPLREDEPPAIRAVDTTTVRIAPGTAGGTPPLAALPAPDSSYASDLSGAWMAFADRQEAGHLWLQPVSRDGSCDASASANWGDPDNPDGPCADYVPVILAGSPVELLGGAGQGILIAAAGVTLRAGSRFRGLILAAGPVDIEADARLDGAVRALGPGAVTIAGAVDYSPCDALGVVRAARGLRHVVSPAGRRWIPAF